MNGVRRLCFALPVRISDPSLTPDLVAFFRRNAFLAVQEAEATIDVLPIRAGSEESDRVRIGRYVEAWLADHPGVVAELVDDDEPDLASAAS
ncbi:MAG TPA: hypothetical protein VG079_00895 [Gaiellaceae bacterium]|nr:hypothetical protein [Gaiellaceae bacterium]